MDDLTRILIYCSINNITSYSTLTSSPPTFPLLLSLPLYLLYPPNTLQPVLSFSFVTPLPLSYSLLMSSSRSALWRKFALLIQSKLLHIIAYAFKKKKYLYQWSNSVNSLQVIIFPF